MYRGRGLHATRETERHATRAALALVLPTLLLLIDVLRTRVLRSALNAAIPLAAPEPGPRDARQGQRRPEHALHPKDGLKDDGPGLHPGAIESESTFEAGEPMNILTLPASPRRFHLGPAQQSALLRWHGPKTQGALMLELSHQPHFPLVNTGSTPAPKRRPRRPTGGPGHVA